MNMHHRHEKDVPRPHRTTTQTPRITMCFLLLFLFSATVCAGTTVDVPRQRMISGTVTDVGGDPLPGVNVSVKGTNTGTVSDAHGNYSIEIPDHETRLLFSFVGFAAQEIVAGEQTRIDVILKEDAQRIEEVVIVGYGIQKKVNLTGAVATLSAGEIRERPVSNLSNALSGKLAGVTLRQSSGGRPGNSSELSIRARGSWNNTDPLYVIDGVVRDKFAFDGLEASDVESLSVLKDGASAAIYGARSANGVVLVNTKKGVAGKPVISYVGSVGLSDATKIPETLNAYDLAQLINDRLIVEGVNSSDARYYTPDEMEHFKTHSYYAIGEYWKQPVLSQHSLNVTGGNDRVRYFIGGSYYYETGPFDNIQYNKYNFRGHIEANITRDLTASLGLFSDLRHDHKPYWRYDSDSDTMFDLWGVLLRYCVPFVPMYIDGKAVGNSMEMNAMEIMSPTTGYNRRKHSNYETNAALQYQVPFVRGLSLRLLYNRYNRHLLTKHFDHPFPMYIFKTTGEHNHIITNEVVGVQMRNDGDFIRERYDSRNDYQLNGFVHYAQTFGKHAVDAVLIYEQAEGTLDWFSGVRNYYISTVIDQLFAGSSDPKDSTVDGGGEETGRLSYAGRVNYVYDDKYILEGSFRYDGSVRFAPKRRWGFFPSLSGAWRISEEQWFKSRIQGIDYLKLRAAVGLLGNDAVGGWQWMQRYNFTSGAIYGTAAKGIQPNVIPNPEITWEKSLTYNVGLDAHLFKNKVSVVFDAFHKHTYDVLGSRVATLPASFGANMPNENYGVVDSKGMEIELGYRGQIHPDVSFYLRGNLSYAVNKLIRKDEAENLRAYKSEIGRNTDRSMGFIATDLLRTQADLDALPEGYTLFGAIPELGMMNYKDVRGAVSDQPDGKIDDNDQEWIMQHTIPPLSYGFSSGVEWKGLALDLVFQGIGKYDVMINQRDVGARNVNTDYSFWKDHYSETNPNAVFPRPYRNQATQASTFWMRNGAFLRLKNINLSYTVPKALLNRSGLSQVRIFFTGTNLFLLEDHIKYFDPEIGNTANNIKCYPITKSYSLGVNLSF